MSWRLVLVLPLIFASIAEECSELTDIINVNLKSSHASDICIHDSLLKEGGALVLQLVPPEAHVVKSSKGHHKDKDKQDTSVNTAGQSTLYFNYESSVAPSKDSHSDTCEFAQFYETCLVTKKEVGDLEHGTIKIQVFCTQGPCKYSIKAINADEESLNEIEAKKLVLNKANPAKVFDLSIPVESEFNRMVVTLKLESTILKADHLAMEFFSKKEMDVQITRSDTRMIATILASDKGLCRKCVVPMVISGSNFKADAELQLTMRKYYDNTEIAIGSSKFQMDYLAQDVVNFYEFDLTGVKYDYLRLGLRSVSGPAKRMYAHFDDNPDELSDYDFDSMDINHDGFVVEELILRPGEGKHKLLTVAIKSGGPGAYSFELNEDTNLELIEVELGQLIFDQLEEELDVQNYYLRIEPQPQKQGRLQLKVVLNQIAGDVIISGTFCDRSKGSCKDKLYTTQDTFQDGDIEFNQDGRDFIGIIDASCEKTQRDSDGMCWYIIGVQALNHVNFMLAAKYAEGSIVLKENEQFGSLVLEDERQYYVYYLESTKKVESLTIRVSTVNVAYLVSRTCEFVTYECSMDVGTNESPVVLSGSELSEGAYYINVIGLEPSMYTVNVEVRRLDETHLIKLGLGETYRSTVNTQNPITCFSYSQSKPDTLTVSLHGPKGKLVLLVSNELDVYPSREEYDEISYSQYLQIESKELTACVEALETAFSPQPYYHEKSYKSFNESWMNETLYSDIHFTISINSPLSTQMLEMNSPHYSIIQPGEKQMFVFLCDPESTLIYITRHVLSQGVGVYHNADESVQIQIGNSPDSEHFEISFEKYHSSTIAIDQKQLLKLCQDDESKRNLEKKPDNDESDYCEVFLAAKSTSTSTQRYTISVYKKEVALPLIEGHQDSFNLEHIVGTNSNDSYIHFYYRPSSRQNDINVFVHSLYGKVGVTLTLWRLTEDVHRSEWPFPGKPNAHDSDYVSGNHNSIHRSIKPDSMEICWPDCVLLISVTYLQDTNDDQLVEALGSLDVEYDDKFNIMVSQLFQEIVTGQKIELSLQPGDFKYFIFHALDKLNQAGDSERLAISLMSFLGKGYFSVSVSDNTVQRVPHVETEADFISRGNYLELTKAQIQDVVAKNQLTWGSLYLIIEVGGYAGLFRDASSHQGSKLEFSISYMDQDVSQLMHGVPHQVVVRSNGVQTLQFFNYYFQDIKIKIFRQSGFGKAMIWTCKPPNDIASCLDDAKQEDFVPLQKVQLTGMAYSQLHLTKDLKNGYCSYCTFLLQLNADVQEMDALVTIQLDNDYVKLQSGVVFPDYVEGENRYVAAYLQDDQVELTVNVLQGDPQFYIDYTEKQNLSQYQIGPLNLTSVHNQDGHHFKVILPPRSILLEQEDHYQIWPMSAEAKTLFKKSGQMPLPMHFIHDELYIVVKGTANYTLLYTSGSVEAQLRDGLIQPVHLSKMQPVGMFIYEHYDLDVKPVLELVALNNTNISKLNVTLRYIPKKNHDDYSFGDIQELQLKVAHVSPDSRTFLIPPEFGLYEFRIDNIDAVQYQMTRDSTAKELDQIYNSDDNNEYSLDFEILISGRDIVLLPLDRTINGYIDPMAVNYYECIVPLKGFVVVEMNSCLGDMQFGHSQNQTEFIAEKYTSEVTNVYGKYLTHQIKVSPGVLFMSIHANQRDSSYYQFTAHYYDNEKSIPFGKLQPGNAGALEWELDTNKLSTIKLKFFAVQCPECGNRLTRRTQVDYQIYWSTEADSLNMFGHCKLQQWNNQERNSQKFRNLPVNSHKMSVDQDYSKKQLEFDLDLSDMDLYSAVYVGVKATVESFDEQPLQMKVLYQTVEVPVPNNLSRILNKNRLLFSVIITGMLIIILFLVVFLIYYARRYKQTRNLLEYEIQDVRNVAGMKIDTNDHDANYSTGLPQTYENLNEDPDA